MAFQPENKEPEFKKNNPTNFLLKVIYGLE